MYDTHASEYSDVAYPDVENLCCLFSLFGMKNDNFPFFFLQFIFVLFFFSIFMTRDIKTGRERKGEGRKGGNEN